MRALVVCLLLLFGGTASVAAQVTARSGSGATPAEITPVRDQFRVDLGGGTVAGANGSFGGLRREINWDAVPSNAAAPNLLPANFFNVNSPRGVVFTTPGSGFQVSATATEPGPPEFGNINPTYTLAFQTFSPQRLFTPLGSNLFDVTFFLPGTGTPALVKGFGLVLTDVDVASTTSLRFFDTGNNSIAVLTAPPQGSGLSFLGGFMTDGQPRIARVRVTLGNTATGASNFDNNGSSDIVVADDFIYGEPIEGSLFADGFESP